MRKFAVGMLAIGFAIVFGMAGQAAAGDAGNGEKIFKGKGKCKTCHRLTAKKKVGPGLKGVTERHTLAWTKKWMKTPQAMWEANDPETAEMKKWKKGRAKKKKTMMKPGKLTDSEIDDLIAFMEQSDGGKFK